MSTLDVLKKLSLPQLQNTVNAAVQRSAAPITKSQTDVAIQETIDFMLQQYPILNYVPAFLIGLTVVELLILWNVWKKR